MAPKQSFLSLVHTLLKDHNIFCVPTQPVWACKCPRTVSQLKSLPTLEFDLIQGPNMKSKIFKMPPQAYMMPQLDKRTGQLACHLLFTPWDFRGIGSKQKGEDYWVLGAQFLKNYYSIYDFENKKVGLVESVTSTIPK